MWLRIDAVIELELQTFANIDDDDPLAAFANDDYLQVDMAYYF